ncbi:MAG TPA: 3,4-dihydroxy-2-butanone-4-phosphate synthase [Pseudonocardiaceae bacterium]|jgi:3,4-dihydroxy 2-butanone 4-phosphate synthase/GTP cyclohydrolase II|nr:3,4-dihydroxy-2-butanone-4-phosphate synthase [Pseudonocardiaceae bacterium]
MTMSPPVPLHGAATTDLDSRVEAAVAAIAHGGVVVVVDDPDREDEGDLVAAAELVTPETINFMATHGRGLICCPVAADQLDRLRIPPMGAGDGDRFGTAFHVGVDHRDAGTGISAADRALAIRALADPHSRPADLRQPGHVFPLAGQPDGVLRRRGHTEASMDLARLAGLAPAAVICEIAGPDGEMARLPALRALAAEHGLPLISIADLVTYRRTHEQLVDRVAEADLPLAGGRFRVIGYRHRIDGGEHLALVHGRPAETAGPLVRIHSECLTGDAFGSLRCDCGPQLNLAIDLISHEPAGVVVYLRGHEGRGIGLVEKICAYAVQDELGMDTVDANLRLGHPVDARDYGVGAQILRDLGVRRPRLLTNNPDKFRALCAYGLNPAARVPLVPPVRPENASYVATKIARLGHLAG